MRVGGGGRTRGRRRGQSGGGMERCYSLTEGLTKNEVGKDLRDDGDGDHEEGGVEEDENGHIYDDDDDDDDARMAISQHCSIKSK